MKSLTLLANHEMTSLEPNGALSDASSATLVLKTVCPGLVRFDHKMQVQPALAQSWTASDDRRRGALFCSRAPVPQWPPGYSRDRGLELPSPFRRACGFGIGQRLCRNAESGGSWRRYGGVRICRTVPVVAHAFGLAYASWRRHAPTNRLGPVPTNSSNGRAAAICCSNATTPIGPPRPCIASASKSFSPPMRPPA